MSLDKDKFVGEGLTYDDVLLVPAYSNVLPRETSLKTRFTRNIQLNVPIVSAGMDTVTESRMAIAIAQEGGIGVLHKNMTIGKQAAEVRKVKRAENGMITDPITIHVDATVRDALNLMSEYHIGGIPVIDSHNVLKGIVTNRDLRFERGLDRPISEVMTSENLITTTEVSFENAADILQQYKIEKLPVVDKSNHLLGLITYKDIIKVKARPNACKDSRGRLRVAAAVGIAANTMERADALVEAGVDALVVDTAHGHSQGVLDMIKALRHQLDNDFFQFVIVDETHTDPTVWPTQDYNMTPGSHTVGVWVVPKTNATPSSEEQSKVSLTLICIPTGEAPYLIPISHNFPGDSDHIPIRFRRVSPADYEANKINEYNASDPDPDMYYWLEPPLNI